jgi:hypothetical protein
MQLIGQMAAASLSPARGMNPGTKGGRSSLLVRGGDSTEDRMYTPL